MEQFRSKFQVKVLVLAANLPIVCQTRGVGRSVWRQREEERQDCALGQRGSAVNVRDDDRWKVDLLCDHGTRWKRCKARSSGAGFKLLYYGVEGKRNGGCQFDGKFNLKKKEEKFWRELHSMLMQARYMTRNDRKEHEQRICYRRVQCQLVVGECR